MTKDGWMERWLPVVFTGVIAVTGVLGLIILTRQLTAMQGQLNLMEANQRAWIYPSEIHVLEVKSRPDVRTFKLAYCLKNVGHLPAAVTVRAKVVSYTKDILDKQKTVCDDGIHEVVRSKGLVYPGGDKTPYSVLPNAQWPYHLSSTLEDDSHADPYTPVVIGCVIYQYAYALSNTFHKSLFYGTISDESKTSPSPRDEFHPIDRDTQFTNDQADRCHTRPGDPPPIDRNTPLTNDRHLVVKAISTINAD